MTISSNNKENNKYIFSNGVNFFEIKLTRSLLLFKLNQIEL
jgi:hypothetical protein